MSPALSRAVDLGISVADGEDVTLCFDSRVLRVAFVDWQERPVVFLCRDAVAFRWQEAGYLLSPDERDDSCYEIMGSVWLRQHEEQNMTTAGQTYHHYKMNFNAAGVLEVICSGIERTAEPGAPPNAGGADAPPASVS